MACVDVFQFGLVIIYAEATDRVPLLLLHESCGRRTFRFRHNGVRCEFLLRFNDDEFLRYPYLPLTMLPRKQTDELLISTALSFATGTPPPDKLSLIEYFCHIVTPLVTQAGRYYAKGLNKTKPIDCGLPEGVSSIQYATETEGQTRKTVGKTICRAYHKCTEEAFKKLALPDGRYSCSANGQVVFADSKKLVPHQEFIQVLQTIARNIHTRQVTQWATNVVRRPLLPHLDELINRSARIVRGRLEANLVSEQNNFMNSEHHKVWVQHIEAASCWFAILCALIHAREIITGRWVKEDVFCEIACVKPRPQLCNKRLRKRCHLNASVIPCFVFFIGAWLAVFVHLLCFFHRGLACCFCPLAFKS